MPDFYRSKKKKKVADTGSLTHQKPYGGGVTGQRQGGSNTDSSSSTFQQGPSQWTNRLSPEWLKSNGKPRNHTISVAIPGSIIRKAQTLELKTALVGQVARILALYEVDEVVVFIDSGYEQAGDPEKGPSVQMSRLLQYVEAPPYLRKKLFPVHKDLKFAGLMPPVDAPHHMMHKEDRSLFREGIVTDKPAGEGRCWVDIGTYEDVRIDHPLRPGIRVTIQLTEQKDQGLPQASSYQCQAVSPNEPREKYGLYWGYQTRLARSFSEIFSSCPFSADGSYDITIGHTTNRGKTAQLTKEGTVLQPLDLPSYSFPEKSSSGSDGGSGKDKDKDKDKDDSKHYLLVFGGAQGLEGCVEADESLSTIAAHADTLFDVYWNALPSNGARAVRTEEELLVSLSKVSGIIQRGLRGGRGGAGAGAGARAAEEGEEERGVGKKKRKV
jgi:methyltransferase